MSQPVKPVNANDVIEALREQLSELNFQNAVLTARCAEYERNEGSTAAAPVSSLVE